MIETLTPRLLISRPSEAVVFPLPAEGTTPPVTKMYLGIRASNEISAISDQRSANGERPLIAFVFDGPIAVGPGCTGAASRRLSRLVAATKLDQRHVTAKRLIS